MSEPCNICGAPATHRCNRFAYEHEWWYYHCDKHANACCEEIPIED